MRDAMLDLETMATGHNAAIVQIGACYFDRHTGEIKDELSLNVNLSSEIRNGFDVDGGTIYWWLSQSKEAQNSIMGNEYESARAVIELNSFLKNIKNIWSHATFDFVIVMNHLTKLDIKPLFHYRAAKDLRTLVHLADLENKKYDGVGTHHNALDDCKFQVQYAVDCFNKLDGR